MWMWKGVLKISWTDQKTNEWVRSKVGVSEENVLRERVEKRKICKYDRRKGGGDSVVLASLV